MEFTEKTTREAITLAGESYSLLYTVNYDKGEMISISGHIRKGNLRCGTVMFTNKSVSLNISAPDGDTVSPGEFQEVLTAVGKDIMQLLTPNLTENGTD